MIDDHSRLAHAEVLHDLTAVCAIAVLRRALAWFAERDGPTLASIGGALSLWGRSAARSDKQAKARAERLAIFVGLWPPTFFLLGKSFRTFEATPDEHVEQARVKAAA
jgi:hypothetical protein